jgi:hypothetical protein
MPCREFNSRFRDFASVGMQGSMKPETCGRGTTLLPARATERLAR